MWLPVERHQQDKLIIKQDGVSCVKTFTMIKGHGKNHVALTSWGFSAAHTILSFQRHGHWLIAASSANEPKCGSKGRRSELDDRALLAAEGHLQKERAFVDMSGIGRTLVSLRPFLGCARCPLGKIGGIESSKETCRAASAVSWSCHRSSWAGLCRICKSYQKPYFRACLKMFRYLWRCEIMSRKLDDDVTE